MDERERGKLLRKMDKLRKDKKFDDYGSLEMPENHLHKGVGRAAGQMNTPYGAGESMTVSSLGQNYNGRAFGY